MDLKWWLWLIFILAAAALAIYGAMILITGRTSRWERRAFRRLRDAGLYYLCLGFASIVIAFGKLLSAQDQPLLTGTALVVTIVLLGLAIRYRPHQIRRSRGRQAKPPSPSSAPVNRRR